MKTCYSYYVILYFTLMVIRVWCSEENLSNAEEAVAFLENQVSRSTNMLTSLKRGAILLEKKAAKCEDELKICNKDLVHSHEVTHLEKNELEDLRERTKHVEDGLSDKEINIKNLKKKITDLEKNITQIILIGQTYRAKNIELKTEIESALELLDKEKNAHESTKEELGLKEKELFGIKDKIKALENSKLVIEIKSMKTKIKELENENKQLIEDNNFIEQEKEGKSMLISSTNEELLNIKNELKNAIALREEIADLNEKLENENEKLKKNNMKLKKDLDNSTSELSNVKHHVKDLDSEKANVEKKIHELSKKEQEAHNESDRLKSLFSQYKEKVDDPALVDYFIKKAEWLKHPKVEGVDQAYEKSMRLFGPKLHPTHVALIEMQTLLQQSTNRLSVSVPKKYSPLVSGLLTYGILLVPLGITFLILVRLKRCISLSKASFLMILYNAIFCLTMFCSSYFLSGLQGKEPMLAFREHNEEAFEFLQIMLPIYYIIFVSCQFLQAIRILFKLRCKCSFIPILIAVLPFTVMYRYYFKVWLLAMHDEQPNLDVKDWLYFAGIFIFLFALNSFAVKRYLNTKKERRSKQNINNAHAVLPLLDKGKSMKFNDSNDDEKTNKKPYKHGQVQEEEAIDKEEYLSPHTININAEIRDPEEFILETAEIVKENAEIIAESFQTNQPIHKVA